MHESTANPLIYVHIEKGLCGSKGFWKNIFLPGEYTSIINILSNNNCSYVSSYIIII